MSIQEILEWLFAPQYVQSDPLDLVVVRIIVVEIITCTLAYLLRNYRLQDTIHQLPEDAVSLMMEGRFTLAYLLLTAYTILEEAGFYGVPIWVTRNLGLQEYTARAEYFASQLWALLHVHPGVVIPLIPMAVLKATLWLTGYWWLSTLWHIVHNTIAYIILVKRI